MKKIIGSILVVIYLAAASSASALPLTYSQGVRASEYSARNWIANPNPESPTYFRIDHCKVQSYSTVKCLIEYPHVQGGEWIDPEGTATPAYTDLLSWSIARRISTNCVKVWEPFFSTEADLNCVPFKIL